MANKNNDNSYDPYNSGDYGDDAYGGGLANLRGTTNGALQASSLKGLFGAPYQFLSSVDRRIENSENALGRKYAEKIMTHAPLLMLTPCRQKFMEGFSSEEQNEIIQSLISGGSPSGNESAGRYYTSQYATSEYYDCVDRMCSEVAHFLGIHNESINGTTIGNIHWQDFKNPQFTKFFAAKKSVVFYADGLVSLQDSFGNSTTESSLSSTINSFGDQAKELRFLLGDNSSAISELMNSASDVVENIGSGLGDLGSNLVGGMLGDLASTGTQVAMAGGKMIFPKIWGDSQSSRSYSFDIKLRSPDHDDISIFMNILVPYIHLLALCLPQSMTQGGVAQNPNAYDTPFLVRAYCKGMFNINMGIITDLSCTRGAEAQWNNSGLPTQMDVSISIEDMYSTLIMSNPEGTAGGFFDVVTNTEMVDFLSNLSGLNIALDSELERRAKLVPFLVGSGIRRIPYRIYSGFENGASNLIRRIFTDI